MVVHLASVPFRVTLIASVMAAFFVAGIVIALVLMNGSAPVVPLPPPPG